MATSAHVRLARPVTAGSALLVAPYALGGLLLAGEAAVHVQQYASLYHAVPWIGPLFLLNAAACVVIIAGLAYPRTRQVAALAGVVVSALALGGLIVSYGQGLFGWQEFGFRTAIAVTVIVEIGAAIALSAGLAADGRLRRPR